MGWEVALIQRLLAHAPLTALVGTRIRAVRAEEKDAYPFVVVQTVADPRPRTMEAPQGFRESMVQIDCCTTGASAGLQAITIRDAVLAALEPDGTFFGVRFETARIANVRPSGEQLDGGEFIRRESVDCMIWHS